MEKPTCFISIISGKGGTGKSLLTTVLGKILAREGKKVLLVDADIFVRGLTILLSDHFHIRDNKKEVSVSEFFYKKSLIVKNSDLLIGRINDCDFVPATRDIGERIKFNSDIDINTQILKDRISNFKNLLKTSEKYDYDYVFFDCRAGIDNSIICISQLSDYIISVAEDDDVSIKTNSNVVNLLRYDFSISNIFTIVNKGRRLQNMNDIANSVLNRLDFNTIGVIPFDAEIMEDYGKERFWNTINETFYFKATIKAWNNFAKRNKLAEVSDSQYKAASILIGSKNNKLNFMQRAFVGYFYLSFVLGVVLIGINTFFSEWSNEKFYIYGFISLLISIFMLIVSKINMRRIILSGDDDPFFKK